MSSRIFAAALLLALPAAGAEPLLPQLRIEPTTGGSIFFVKNVSAQPLTAYLIELVDYPGSFYQLWQDEITGEPIAPAKEKRIPVANMTVGAVPDYVKIQAAVYADGTTAGVAEKVAILLGRRKFSLDTVHDMLRRVEAGKAANTPKEAISANLRQAAEFMLLSAKVDKASAIWVNQAAGRALFSDGASYLDKHSLEETLANLHAWEKAIAESKPPV
jgi:hypothetical protein